MNLTEAFELTEARGSGSFDYKYWFWAQKDNSTYGIGYARQDIQLDIKKKGKELADAAENLKDVIQSIDDEDVEFEVAEKKIKANTKRLKGIIDLFHSPIIIYWLNNDPPTTVEIPEKKESDVTDSRGRHINVVDIFSDPKTSDLVYELDWDKVKISEDTTLNTIAAKFFKDLMSRDESSKKIRAIARGEVLDTVMKDISFKTENVEVKSFDEGDYDIIPDELIGSKKVVSKLKEIIKDNFAEILKKARSKF
jgi:hypothetical protein